MITFVAFSLNRAMQLEALLSSMDRWVTASSKPHMSIKVLYGYTDDKFGEGYRALIQRVPPGLGVEFIRKERGKYKTDISLLCRPWNLYRYIKYPFLRDIQSIFNFKELLEGILQSSNDECAAFLTDDSMFYRVVNIDVEILHVLQENPRQNSFSFRHGLNIEGGGPQGRKHGEFWEWSFYSEGNSDFWSYPFSIDGHVYSREFLLQFMRKVLYVNPNSLEGFLSTDARSNGLFSTGFCFDKSVLLSFPINMVQTIIPNDSLGIDVALLNERFLDGYSLEYRYSDNPAKFQQVPIELNLVRKNERLRIY
jgi:hypothetical protein